MESKEGHLYDLIVTPNYRKVYGWLLFTGAALIGVGVVFAALAGRPVNFPLMVSTFAYVCFMFFRVYRSRSHGPTRDRLKSATPEQAWSVMVGGYLWALPAFVALVLIYHFSARAFY